MTQFHRPLLIMLLLFGSLLTGCKTKPVSASFYQNHVTSHRSDTWNYETVRVTHLNGHTVGSNGCIGGTSLKDVSLMVNYLEDSTGNPGEDDCQAVKVSIDSIHHGMMWMPIFKHFSFNSNVPVKFERILFLPLGDSTQRVWYRVNGKIKVDGKMKINGFCSYEEARRLMVKCIIDNVYIAVRKEMDEIK